MAAPGDVVLRAATWQNDRTEIQAVRRRVFIEEQRVPEAEEWDATDPVAHHVLALDGKRDAVGTGRLAPGGKIGRVAVLPQYRGAGVGSGIVGHFVNLAAELGLARVYLHAQTATLRFYERLGFRAEGPEFDEVGIPHRLMRLGIEPGDERRAGRGGYPEHPLDAR